MLNKIRANPSRVTFGLTFLISLIVAWLHRKQIYCVMQDPVNQYIFTLVVFLIPLVSGFIAGELFSSFKTMLRAIGSAVAVASVLVILPILLWPPLPSGDCGAPTPMPTEAATPTSTDTPTPTKAATLAPTDTPTDGPTPTHTPTPTDTPTPTLTPTDTPTPTLTPSPTNTPTPTPVPAIVPGRYPIGKSQTVDLFGDWIFTVVAVEVDANRWMKVEVSWQWIMDPQYPEGTTLTKYSDAGNRHMYLMDNLRTRLNHTETGGAAAQDTVMHSGDTIHGWFKFPPAVTGAFKFQFHDDERGIVIEGIILR